MPNQSKGHMHNSHRLTREDCSNIEHQSNGRRQAHHNYNYTDEPEPHTTSHKQCGELFQWEQLACQLCIGHKMVHNTIIHSG